ncbi:putative anti-sigma factor [Lunatimonas lonarensis]|uniref:Putative anti-sigma factor n=1 Tax=Lunatimonas lonarensis TaxID=1232681 RepID=R7ZQU0_9BACT|nr:FecR domain-containing protein [Lunatimonas lonarensis]EON76379.1 putative anti-sigma factor [Lunatimonas lonarensis]
MAGLLQTWRTFLKGGLSEGEAITFIDRLKSASGKRVFFDGVDAAFKEMENSPVPIDWDGERLLSGILIKKKRHDRFSFGRKKIVRFCCSGLVASLFLCGVFLVGGTRSFVQSSHSPEPMAEPEIIVKYNPKGKRTKILLPDSSWVFLNADSYLSYERGFENGRVVRLVGEAFFEVAKDSLRPFQVITGRLQTTALGTSFNVTAYADGQGMQVTLATGKVIVEDQVLNQDQILAPGEATKVGAALTNLQKIKTDPVVASSWKDGVLQFDRLPFSEMVLLLERWYGVQIHGPAVWPDHLCSGTFRKNEYLSNVLKALGHSIGFTYSIHGKNVQLVIKP